MFLVPDDFIFPMNMDVYYASQEQDQFGKVQKRYSFDRTIGGSVSVFGTGTTISNRRGVDPTQLLEYRDKLIGRLKENPLEMDDGTYRVITNILITNIRDARTGESFYFETDKKTRQTFPTQFEIHIMHPYINPWNEIEYWELALNRIERQDVTLP